MSPTCRIIASVWVFPPLTTGSELFCSVSLPLLSSGPSDSPMQRNSPSSSFTVSSRCAVCAEIWSDLLAVPFCISLFLFVVGYSFTSSGNMNPDLHIFWETGD